VKPAHAISLIQSAYRLDLPTESWLIEVAATASRALGSDAGAMAFQYDASSGARIDTGAPALHKLSPDAARDIFSQDAVSAEHAQGMARVFASLRFASLRKVIEELGFGSFGEILDRHGIDDIVGVNGLDPTRRGCMLALVDRRRDYSRRTAQLWHRLAAHVSAGNRLRTTFATLASPESDPTSHAEAVLAPSGRVEHATGAAEPRTAREALREALVRIDAARSERDDANRSAELWQGLVAGRWSLVEHFERDGRRYYLAHKNDPELAPDRALTQRECQVVGYAELGHSNKLIGYALGLSTSSVSTLLTRARRKLGVINGSDGEK
jgi:DNA-binding CsgD family transcriptional regulator